MRCSWEPPWHHFGDHVDLLGRSVTLSWLSWHVLGHNFDRLDVQSSKPRISQLFQPRMFLSSLHMSFALVICTISCYHVASTSCLHLALFKCTPPLHWSIVALMCISSAPFNLTSHVQLALKWHLTSSCLRLSFAPLIANSYLHL